MPRQSPTWLMASVYKDLTSPEKANLSPASRQNYRTTQACRMLFKMPFAISKSLATPKLVTKLSENTSNFKRTNSILRMVKGRGKIPWCTSRAVPWWVILKTKVNFRNRITFGTGPANQKFRDPVRISAQLKSIPSKVSPTTKEKLRPKKYCRNNVESPFAPPHCRSPNSIKKVLSLLKMPSPL
jgi:hypothetical protein